MRRLLLASLSVAAISSSAFAQDSTSYTVISEPVSAPMSDYLINAPIEYDERGVAKAQHFTASDLSPEQYQALLDEADRVRSYQQSNGVYVRPETAAPAAAYEIELYAEPAPVTMYTPAPSYETYVEPVAVASAATVHTVVKGDTLFNISKRYATTVSALQQANGISGSSISLGQQITVPGTTNLSMNTYAPQVSFASAPITDGYITRRVVEPVPSAAQTQSASQDGGTVYAVLPKDTLYAISRRSCVAVPALISANDLMDPSALTPGQRLAIPSGHCLGT